MKGLLKRIEDLMDILAKARVMTMSGELKAIKEKYHAADDRAG
jgi:hypothetical protein